MISLRPAFERALSEYVGGRPVRVVTSATGAMQVALEMLGVGPGDPEVMPPEIGDLIDSLHQRFYQHACGVE